VTCPWGRHCDAGNASPDPEHFVIRTTPASTFSPGPAEDGALSRWVQSGGAIEWRSHVCPLPLINKGSSELLRLHGFWQDRLMPLAGGVLDQPNGIIRAMEIASARLARPK
jgi:hypothetical protein